MPNNKLLYLKAVNREDVLKEYEAINKIPANEKGFENRYFGCALKDFEDNIINKLINDSKGINLPEGYVACTYYFLWEDENIVGLIKIRHKLSEQLKKVGGHIGYCILSEYRGKGYATKGLALAIEEAKKIVQEDEILMTVRKGNEASLKVQLKNGAKIVDENDERYYTTIKIR